MTGNPVRNDLLEVARPVAWASGLFATLALTLLLPAASPSPLHAQQTPPEPLPMEEVAFPPFEERALDNGARLLVVSQGEVPFVSVNLVLPGGQSVDPGDELGLAEMTAGLLTKGTATRSADSVARAVDFLGAALSASAGTDWTTVSAGAVTSVLPDVLELMADVVMNPSFPAEELDLLRVRTLSALRQALSQPGMVADRTFIEAIYGDHPYGQLATPQTLQALDRASVVEFHDRWFRPDSALFVVAGDVTADRAEELLEEAFRGWSPGEVPAVEYGPVPTTGRPRMILVHQPGSVQSVVRAGHPLMHGTDDDWTPLSVANQILGAGPTGRLFEVLREEMGLTYGAYSTVQRRRDRGYFRAQVETRTEATGEALEALLGEIDRMRSEMVAPDELKDARDFLVGSFPLQIETPQQIAGQVTRARLLGLPASHLETYRERVADVGPQTVRRVVSEHIDPQDMTVVVVGDAARVHGQLTTFGPVEVRTPGGQSLDIAELLPAQRSETLDASLLEPLRLEYRMMFQGQEVGTVTRTLVPGDTAGVMRFEGEADIGPQQVAQSVTFEAATFEPLAADATITVQGQTIAMDVEVRDGRLVGTVRTPQGPQQIDQPVPAGALVGDMAELALWIATLEEGEELTMPVVQVESGSVSNVTYVVGPVEEVTVPAGTFQAWRIEMGGPQPQTVWARVEAPHVLVKLEPGGQPVVMELVSVERPGR